MIKENESRVTAHESATVYLIDDDPSYRSGMARLLRAKGFQFEAYDSAQSFLHDRDLDQEGCVVVDLQMPEMNGLELQRHLACSANPLPVIFLTGQGDIPTSVEAMRGGAEDFLTKMVSHEELFAAIQRALDRDVEERSQRRTRRALVSRFALLTPREEEVLRHVLTGELNKQIASALQIDERSVKRHRTSFMRKLDVQSVPELTQLALAAGFV